MGGKVQPIPREVLESFRRSLAIPGSYILKSDKQLLEAFCDPKHWLNKCLIPTADEISSLSRFLRGIRRQQGVDKVLEAVDQLLPFASRRELEVPPKVWTAYLEAITSGDFAIGPRYDTRKPGQGVREFELDASQALRFEDVANVRYGNVGLYGLILELRTHPNLKNYDRSISGLVTCACTVISEANLAGEATKVQASLATMVEAVEEMQSYSSLPSAVKISC